MVRRKGWAHVLYDFVFFPPTYSICNILFTLKMSGLKCFLTWTLAQFASPQKSQSCDCITPYQKAESSLTVASGVSPHISFKLYNKEEGTPPLWSGCFSPQSLNPNEELPNVELKRKQSMEAENPRCKIEANQLHICHLTPSYNTDVTPLLTTGSLWVLKQHKDCCLKRSSSAWWISEDTCGKSESQSESERFSLVITQVTPGKLVIHYLSGY